MNSGRMSAPAGEPLCGANQLYNPSTVFVYVRVQYVLLGRRMELDVFKGSN